MRAVRRHCQTPWVLLYVERWLKAPLQSTDGEVRARVRGTPQGGVRFATSGKSVPALCF
jgi:RNA-directed DNA polymerase